MLTARIRRISGLSPSSLLAILIAFFLDQLTKSLIVNLIGPRPVSLLGSLLRLQVVYNTRGIFGLSFGSNQIYFLLPIIGIVVLGYLLFMSHNRMESIVVGLIVGGALGNLIDRIRIGAVVDFIDMGIGRLRWPTYNLADAFITIGIIILILRGFGPKRVSPAQERKDR